jgi:hypothetical protein
VDFEYGYIRDVGDHPSETWQLYQQRENAICFIVLLLIQILLQGESFGYIGTSCELIRD